MERCQLLLFSYSNQLNKKRKIGEPQQNVNAEEGVSGFFKDFFSVSYAGLLKIHVSILYVYLHN
jgi:hypothetical protein